MFGDKVEGVFDIDSLMGTGCRKTYSNGNIFEGRIEELKADGYGVMTFENGNKI